MIAPSLSKYGRDTKKTPVIGAIQRGGKVMVCAVKKLYSLFGEVFFIWNERYHKYQEGFLPILLLFCLVSND